MRYFLPQRKKNIDILKKSPSFSSSLSSVVESLFLNIYILVLFICVSLCVYAGQVELISNFSVDVDKINERLDLHLVASDLSKYSSELKKKRGFLSKLANEILSYIPAEIDPQTTHLLFWNMRGSYSSKFNLRRLPKEKMVLFLWEPPTLMPKMYSRKLWECFSKVYTWDDDLVDGHHYFKFYYPVLHPMQADLPPFEERKLCTFIGTNVSSRYPKELYSERRAAITFFERVGEEGFEFYGRWWESEKHPSYRGVVEDKMEALKKYRFSICYENTRDIKGYITEKIFDSFSAGCVPIYWGASNITDYIPAECFIDRRDFDSLEALHEYLKAVDKARYEEYLVQINSFLRSDKAQCFSQGRFDRLLKEALK